MKYASIDGLRIGYEHYASQTEGNLSRVIFIHGTGCNSRVFERHFEVLSTRHEVAAIDLPGHGESTGSGFRGVADYAHYVAGLIKHLEWEGCVVAGHSLGGAIALAMALYYPKYVERLLLIDTGARLRVNSEILETARRAAEGEDLPPSNPRRGFARGTSQEIVDEINAITEQCSPLVTYKDWIADDTCDLMSRLPSIIVPSLAICGDEDEFTPIKYHEYFRDKLPNCQLEIISDAGHWPFVEQPKLFDRTVLEFLDSLRST